MIAWLKENPKAAAGIAIALLALLATWGSREISRKQEIQESQQIRDYQAEKIRTLETETMTLRTNLKRATETIKRRGTRTAADGSTETWDDEISRTLDEARSEAVREIKAELETSQAQIRELQQRLQAAQQETVKPGPRLSATVQVPVLTIGDPTAWRAGLGVNFGNLTVGVSNPVEWAVKPTADLSLRF